MTTAIEVRNLVVERGKNRVLHGLTCTIPRGSVTGLLGPSGSGKTTLMRAIVGVQRVRSGTVTVLGEPAGSSRLRDQIGYLTQAPSVYADLSVRENARYFASLYRGITRADADEAVVNVGLGDAAGQLVGTLSGGQQARFLVLLLELSGATLLLLDEPTDNLDLASAEALEEALTGFAGTVIAVTHDRWFTRSFDRFVLFGSDGEVVETEEPVWDVR